ncbi:MAG: hypothetical protein ACJAZO_004019 [Myxococcota bacterium]|jgi:hypothetical protein
MVPVHNGSGSALEAFGSEEGLHHGIELRKVDERLDVGLLGGGASSEDGEERKCAHAHV